MAMDVQKIKIKGDYKLPDIVHEIEKGILRIPQFQREFIWDKPRVIRLLESIYNEYPIGSFFFWDAPRKYYDFYRDIAELGLPQPDKYEKISFILDGQQRITSLYVTVKGLNLYGKDYGKICFDLDEKKFVDRYPDNQRWVAVRDLLSNETFDIPENLTSERKKTFWECRQRFYNYPFSAIDIRDKELDEVCDIFERINQGGQKLNLFDLISAGTWTTDFDLRKEVDKENEKLKAKGFGEIDNEVFVQALALIAKGSCTRPSQLQLRPEDIKQCWKSTLDSIELAIDFLRGNLGVINSFFIPYRSMIAIVAYLFYRNKNKSLSHQQSENISLWFWQASFAERYTSSTLTFMTEDRKLIDKIAEEREISIKYPFDLSIESLMEIRMYRKSAIKNGILCLLARKNPRHFINNSLLPLGESYYSDFNSSEKHHIFPKSLIQKKYPLIMVHSLPNFCFLPAELNKEISNKPPARYFSDFTQKNPDFDQTLKSHLIRYDDSIKNNDFTSFLSARAAVMLEEITAVTGSKISRVIVSDVNLAIDKTEVALRDLIDKKLSTINPNYWKSLIPGDIIQIIRTKVDEYLKKDPSKKLSSFTPRDFLDYCDIMDYSKIILFNWDNFYTIFRSKTELERKFINLKEYRNNIKHGHGEMANFIKKEGEAALEWLEAALSSTTFHKSKTKISLDENQLPKRYLTRKEFWKKLLEKMKGKTELFSKINPTIYHYIATGAGKSGFSYVFSIVTNNGACELYIDRGKNSQSYNKSVFDKLFKNKEEIEKVFGDTLEWERLDNSRACRIAKRFYEGGLYDKDNWDKLQDKMIAAMICLEKALRDYIKN